MQHNHNNNIKKEKFELNILSTNLGCKTNFIKSNSNNQRPDSLEIKVKPENIVNITESYLDGVSNWTGNSLDNFILQIKNGNNTPSPITPNSFFNPCDVTQDQEQFADALTLHLNKIKEEYKSGTENDAEASYLNNIIQISSINQEKPIPIATVSLGNKVYLLNQIGQNIDSNENQYLNYGVMDLQNHISLHNDNNNQISQQPLKLSQFQSLCSAINQPTLLGPAQNLQFPTSYMKGNNKEVSQILSNSDQQSFNLLKTSEGVVYSRVSDAKQSELLSQLNSLTNSNPNIVRINPNVVKTAFDHDCFSASSNENDSSYGTNDSFVKTEQKDYSGNVNKLPPKEEKDLDDVQLRLERKRARNRDAARKCRDRKNTLISTLEQKYAKQSAEKDLIREKLQKSLEEIRRLTDYISKHDPQCKFANFSSFLNEIKIHELTESDLKDLNML